MNDTEQSEAPSKEWEEKRRIAGLPFAELTVDQKFERVTQYVRQFEYATNRIATLENQVRQLQTHSHNEYGVVVPINSNGLGGVLSGGSAKLVSSRHPLD